jgi:hypothetical protein
MPVNGDKRTVSRLPNHNTVRAQDESINPTVQNHQTIWTVGFPRDEPNRNYCTSIVTGSDAIPLQITRTSFSPVSMLPGTSK